MRDEMASPLTCCSRGVGGGGDVQKEEKASNSSRHTALCK